MFLKRQEGLTVVENHLFERANSTISAKERIQTKMHNIERGFFRFPEISKFKESVDNNAYPKEDIIFNPNPFMYENFYFPMYLKCKSIPNGFYLNLAEEVKNYMSKCWPIFEDPKLILSFNSDGAHSLPVHEAEQLLDDLKRIIFDADAWVLTDGTNSEVNSFVTRACHFEAEDMYTKIPFHMIGILTEQPKNMSVALEDLNTIYQDPGKTLLFSHSMFVISDNDKQTRKELEAAMRKQYNIPVINLVFGGDEQTLNDVFVSMYRSIPNIVIEGSGGVADLLVFAHTFLNSTSAKSEEYSLSALRMKIVAVFPSKTKNEVDLCVAKITSCVNDQPTFFVFSRSDEKITLTDVIVNAIKLTLNPPRQGADAAV